MGLHQNREYTSSLLSNTNLHYLIDEDVHNGIIFNQDNNNNNLYDILIQGHYQYVTLNRCYIFKKFVENGEIIISLNANTFYAEVNYDILNNQITFVKCHLLNAIIGLLMEKRQWRLVKEKKKDGMMQLLNVPELILAVIFVQLLLIIIPFHIHI